MTTRCKESIEVAYRHANQSPSTVHHVGLEPNSNVSNYGTAASKREERGKDEKADHDLLENTENEKEEVRTANQVVR